MTFRSCSFEKNVYRNYGVWLIEAISHSVWVFLGILHSGKVKKSKRTPNIPLEHTPGIPFCPQMIQEFRIINCWLGSGVCSRGYVVELLENNGDVSLRTVDGRNPAPVDMVYKYPIIYRVWYIPGGAGSLPSTVCWFSRSFTELRNLLMYIHQQYLRVLQNSTGSQDDP